MRPVCPAGKGTGRTVEQFTGVAPDFGDVRKQVSFRLPADGCAVGFGKTVLF